MIDSSSASGEFTTDGSDPQQAAITANPLPDADELGLTKKTIVLFTGDHGYNIGHHAIHTKGNGYSIAGGAGPLLDDSVQTA
jgi:hypothetical protein